jgi:hypothetical protein
MPRCRIRLINSDFESADESDYPSLEAAVRAAIVGATEVVSEAIAAGEQSAAVEVQVDCNDVLVARKVVALTIADVSGNKQTAI